MSTDVAYFFLRCEDGIEEVPKFGFREGRAFVPEELYGVSEENRVVVVGDLRERGWYGEIAATGASRAFLKVAILEGEEEEAVFFRVDVMAVDGRSPSFICFFLCEDLGL